MDRISDLPDEIIIKILSFLSIDKAATTSLLSKRWRDIFVFTPNLHLSFVSRLNYPSDMASYRKRFINFVERMLAASGNSVIRSFTMKCVGIKPAHANRWIRNVLKRGGVTELDLQACDYDSLLLPKVFACKKVVNLKLQGFRIPMLPKDASLPALKSLSLVSITCDNIGAFEKLISVSPLLEEVMYFAYGCEYWKLSHFLSGPNLKRLITNSPHSFEFGNMSFDHPNLVYLEYSGCVQLQYPVVNLGSLVEAKLDIFNKKGDPANCDPTNLIKGLRNVKVLSLSFPKTFEIFEKFHEAVPVFEKLYHLSIEYQYEEDFCLSASPLHFLLKKCPNLQTLVIKYHSSRNLESNCVCRHFSGNSSLLSSPVKVLEYTKYNGSTRELGQIKRFLEELPCLELVKVCASAKDDKEKLQLTTDLLKLHRASSKCGIQVEFSS